MSFQRVNHEAISREVIKELPTDRLQKARDFIVSLQELRSFTKLYTTYYKGVKKAIEYNGENKVYYNFKFDGTVTGRLSCAAYTNKGISFHTLPRNKEEEDEQGIPNIRDMFVPPDDWVFITADYKVMELRILAHVCGDENLIKAFLSGEDLHKYTASLIFEKPISEITKRERQIAKSVSFLIVYGGSAYKLSQQVSIPLVQAEGIIERFSTVYPKVFSWMDEVRKELKKHKYVKSLFGRYRNLKNIKSISAKIRSRAERQAINFKIQNPASDIVCFALLDINNSLSSEGFLARLVASVHDSIEIVCPREELEQVLAIMHYKMTQYPLLRKVMGFNCVVPLLIDIEAGKSFGHGTPVLFNESGYPTNIEEILHEL